MWSFKRILRAAAWSVVLAAPVALSGCSGLSPVYGSANLGTERLAINYGTPTNRLEQIVYEDLMLRLGKPNGGPAPTVSVSVYRGGRALNNDTIWAPNNQKQMVVTSNISVTAADGRPLFSGSRSATADYTTDSQTLANQQAAEEAAVRGAHLLAETIRLEVMAALKR